MKALIRLGPTLTAVIAGVTGGLVFASALLLLESPNAGLRYWGPVAIALAVSLGAAFGSQLLGTLQSGAEEATPEEGAGPSFSALPIGGLLPTADAMVRFDEELRLAGEFARPLCVSLIGLDGEAGVDPIDAREALRQLAAGAVRRQDLVTDRGDAELLILLLETSYSAGWVVAERIHRRVSAAGIGSLRCVLLAPAPDDSLRDVLDELDGGLAVCRALQVVFADPSRLLATSAPG